MRRAHLQGINSHTDFNSLNQPFSSNRCTRTCVGRRQRSPPTWTTCVPARCSNSSSAPLRTSWESATRRGSPLWSSQVCTAVKRQSRNLLLLLYSAVLRSWADSQPSHVILHKWIAFYAHFLNIRWSGVLTALAWLVPHETAAISAHSVYTIQPCTMSLHAKPHT